MLWRNDPIVQVINEVVREGGANATLTFRRETVITAIDAPYMPILWTVALLSLNAALIWKITHVLLHHEHWGILTALPEAPGTRGEALRFRWIRWMRSDAEAYTTEHSRAIHVSAARQEIRRRRIWYTALGVGIGGTLLVTHALGRWSLPTVGFLDLLTTVGIGEQLIELWAFLTDEVPATEVGKIAWTIRLKNFFSGLGLAGEILVSAITLLLAGRAFLPQIKTLLTSIFETFGPAIVNFLALRRAIPGAPPQAAIPEPAGPPATSAPVVDSAKRRGRGRPARVRAAPVAVQQPIQIPPGMTWREFTRQLSQWLELLVIIASSVYIGLTIGSSGRQGEAAALLAASLQMQTPDDAEEEGEKASV
jgi:hypothetical protein